MALIYLSTKAKKTPSWVSFLFGGRGWIRTIEAEKQQIYSLPPLATRELSRVNAAYHTTKLRPCQASFLEKIYFFAAFLKTYPLVWDSQQRGRTVYTQRYSAADILRSGSGGRAGCGGRLCYMYF